MFNQSLEISWRMQIKSSSKLTWSDMKNYARLHMVRLKVGSSRKILCQGLSISPSQLILKHFRTWWIKLCIKPWSISQQPSSILFRIVWLKCLRKE
jgi:hypothetical protein